MIRNLSKDVFYDRESYEKKMVELHIGLIHHPVYNRNKHIVSTTITHFDVHDIARICRSYGVKKYHLIHPSEEQLMFVERLKNHWSVGSGKEFNPLRAEAMKIISTAESLEKLKAQEGIDQTFATSAKNHETYPQLSFMDFRTKFHGDEWAEKKILIVFGTGSGLVNTVYEQCDGLIEPIEGFPGSDFRHLSVRSAVAIVLDRIRRT